MEAGIHPSLQTSCHHQMLYANFNLKIHYLALYEREAWYFQKADIDLIRRVMDGFNKADIDLIRRAMDGFNWEMAFFNLNINEMV